MGIISASIVSKGGKVLVSRQFYEISSTRIVLLLSNFPKLLSKQSQHTLIETDSLRYMYQPLGIFYFVLMTTLQSNILEDLQVMKLLNRYITELCHNPEDENIIYDNTFEILFAFDETIAFFGRKDISSLSQLKTVLKMESHEENIYSIISKNKENEARETTRRRAKEIDREKKLRNTKAPTSATSIRDFTSPTSSIETIEDDNNSDDNNNEEDNKLLQNSKSIKKGMKLGKGTRNRLN